MMPADPTGPEPARASPSPSAAAAAAEPACSPGRAPVAVIGAGIVGACVAWELRKRGHEVVLIDRDEPGRGASFGNSGAISPGSVAPLAMPGVLGSVPGMLLDPSAPLYLPPSYLVTAFPWLARFVAAARPERVRAIAAELAALHAGAIGNHLRLAAEIGAPELVIRAGHLHLYRDAAARAADEASWDLRRRHGVAFEALDRDGVLALEPAVGPAYAAGVFLADHATCTNPFRYVTRIVEAFVARGGRLVRDRLVSLEPAADGRWTCVGERARHPASQVVLAAGAWSLELLRTVGLHAPLETQRGYHVTFQVDRAPVSRTVVLTDRKIFLAPMETGLRAGGTVEFGGLAREPDYARADRLAAFTVEAFPSLARAPFTKWMGHRPCMPDTLPRVGPVDGRPGMWLAFGHGHLGLTDSANSAKVIAELMTPAAA
jgi:D-amino-acid dehydrogenase